MAKKRAPKTTDWADGDYLVTAPAWGVKNAWVGEFKDQDKPRVRHLSVEQAKELAGPNHPFAVEPVKPEEKTDA